MKRCQDSSNLHSEVAYMKAASESPKVSELEYKVEEERPLRPRPEIRVHEAEEEDEIDIDELGEDSPPHRPRNGAGGEKRTSVHLLVEDGKGLKKSISLTSISSRVKEKANQLKNNQIAGVVFFLVVGLLCSIISYLLSVYAAQLNKELIDTAVHNQETLSKKLKRSLVEGPSKYVVGALNFGGRMLSSIGTVMLVQVIVAYVKRRRYNLVLRSAAGETDQVVGEVHTGVTDAAGELIMHCIQAFS